jgi:hypothetical protein
MLETAPLSVCGEGWGRWNTRTSSKSTTATLEPALSATSAPSALNRDSMSDQETRDITASRPIEYLL